MGTLIAALTALQFPATWLNPVTLVEEACPFTGQNVFSTVKPFDFEDMGKAFDELLAYEDRVAFVILTDEEQHAKFEGKSMWVFFRDVFTILYCDRSHIERNSALTGDTLSPGVEFMSDVVTRGIMGEPTQLGVSGVIIEPMGGEVFAMKAENRADQWGRVGWRQVVRMHAAPEGRSISVTAMETFSQPNPV